MNARRLLFISIGLYLACLPLHAFATNSGFDVLVGGWLGILYMQLRSVANLLWLSNLTLFLSWGLISLRMKKPAIILSGVSLAVSGFFPILKGVALDESGILWPIKNIGFGYFLWLASMAVTCLAAFMISANKSPTKKPSPD